MQTYDVVIIGGGHNGLTFAAYLGMAGLKVAPKAKFGLRLPPEPVKSQPLRLGMWSDNP